MHQVVPMIVDEISYSKKFVSKKFIEVYRYYCG